MALPSRIFGGCTLSDVSPAPVPDPLRQPYDFAIRVLAEVPDGPEVLSDRLRSLRPALTALRRSYFSVPVRVRYEDPAIACAYLLAYLPHLSGEASPKSHTKSLMSHGVTRTANTPLSRCSTGNHH